MPYQVKYRSEFRNRNNDLLRIDISEDNFSGTITLFDSVNPQLEYTGEDNKFPGIKQSTLTFGVYVTPDLQPDDFINETEKQYKVQLYLNSNLQWSGWMDNKNASFSWLDYGYVMELTAKDGLHLLESAPLRNLSNDELWISYKAVEYITWCLNATDLGLNFWTWINIYPENVATRSTSNPERDPFNYTFIDSRTFENDFCLTILNKIIVGFGCVMFQAEGKWHIIHIGDWIRGEGISGTQWNKNGVAQGILLNQDLQISIGLNQAYKFIEGTNASYQLPHKRVKYSYAFESPNRIRNIDLSKGNFFGFITQNSIPYAIYNLDHWTQTPGVSVLRIASASDVNNEEESQSGRVIQAIRQGFPNFEQFEIKSTNASVQGGDKFSFSFSYGLGDPINNWVSRLRVDVKLNQTAPGVDLWLDHDGKWKPTKPFRAIPNLDSNGAFYTVVNPGTFTLATEEPIPPLGSSIDIFIYVSYTPPGGIGINAPNNSLLHAVWDLSFGYEPLAAQPNKIAQGHFVTCEQNQHKEVFEEQTYISDSRNITFKGTIFSNVSNIYRYWQYAGLSRKIRFVQLLAEMYYKLLHRRFLILEGNVLNAINANNTGLISPLWLSVIETRPFMITDININLADNTFDAVMIEVTDGNDFDVVPDKIEFKLIDAKDRDFLTKFPDLPKRVPRSNKRFVRFIDSIMTSIFGGGPTPE